MNLDLQRVFSHENVGTGQILHAQQIQQLVNATFQTMTNSVQRQQNVSKGTDAMKIRGILHMNQDVSPASSILFRQHHSTG